MVLHKVSKMYTITIHHLKCVYKYIYMYICMYIKYIYYILYALITALYGSAVGSMQFGLGVETWEC